MNSCCSRGVSVSTRDESISTSRAANTNPRRPPIVVTREQCIAGVILTILSPFIFLAAFKLFVLVWGSADPWPTFILESVSVSLKDDVANNTSQMNVDWNIGFYVEYVKPSADFKVSVQSMLRNSTMFALSGNGLSWKETSDRSNSARGSATVSSLLPRFNTTNAGLEFDVNFWASGHGSYSEFNNLCQGVKLEFSPSGNSGFMVGKRMECI